LAANDRWSKAMLEHDLSSIDRLLAEDYSYIDPIGNTGTKKDEINSLRGAGAIFKSFATADVQVSIYDSNALLTGVITAKVTAALGGGSASYRYSALYVNRRNQWRLVFLQATPIKPSLPRPSIAQLQIHSQ